MKKEKIIEVKLQRDYKLVQPRKRKLKSYEEFGVFLMTLERMPEYEIRKIMGSDYVDTPGCYYDEKKYYDTIIDFMIANLGESEYGRLEQWYIKNPRKVKRIMEWK